MSKGLAKATILLVVFKILLIGLESAVVNYFFGFVVMIISALVYRTSVIQTILRSKKVKITVFLFIGIFTLSTIVGMLNAEFVFFTSQSGQIQSLLKIFLIFCILISTFYSVAKLGFSYVEKFIVAALFLHVCIGLVMALVGIRVDIQGDARIAGLTGHVNTYSLCCFLLVVYLLPDALRRLFSLRAGIVIVSLCGLILSLTLSYIAAVVVVFVVIAWKMKLFRRVGSGIFVTVAIAAVSFLDLSGLFQRLETINISSAVFSVEEGDILNNSFEWRLLHWRLLLNDWVNNYFYFGVGIGNAVHMRALKGDDGVGFNPHNDWILFLVEFGVVAVSVFFFTLWRMVRLAIATLDDPSVKSRIVAATLGLSISMAFGPTVTTVSFMYAYIPLLAAAYTTALIQRRSQLYMLH